MAIKHETPGRAAQVLRYAAARAGHRIYDYLCAQLFRGGRDTPALTSRSDLRALAAAARGVLGFPAGAGQMRAAARHFLISIQRPDGAFARIDENPSVAAIQTAIVLRGLAHCPDDEARFAAVRSRSFLSAVAELAVSDDASRSAGALAACLLGLTHIEKLATGTSGDVEITKHLRTRLLANQGRSGGWSVREREVDPFLTALALQSLIASAVTGPHEEKAIVHAADALKALQRDNGCWSDPEQDILEAPRVTGQALLALSALDRDDISVSAGVSWLLGTQEEVGGWQRDPTLNRAPSVVATAAPFLALIAFAGELMAEPSLSWATVSRDLAADVPDLYAVRYIDSWHGLPYTRPLDHTMAWALDDYARQKVPFEVLADTIAKDGAVEIHQILPAHFQDRAEALGFSECVEVPFKKKPAEKRWNYGRPGFFSVRRDGCPRLCVAVIPGRDYFFHYASIVRHATRLLTTDAEQRVILFRYPIAETFFFGWAGLGAAFVSPGDRVVLGYVNEIEELLSGVADVKALGSHRNEYFGSTRYRLPDGTVLNLIGVTLSYWGSLGGDVVRRICRLGASEIIYIAKLGCLTGFEDVYSKIFVPDQFAVLHHSEVIEVVSGLPNGILAAKPELATGLHVSVPTVLEEDYLQRATAEHLHASSIDNEISQMAVNVALHNNVHADAVRFSATHFATDYIRGPKQRTLRTDFDLSNDKTEAARHHKRGMIQRIAKNVLFPYLGVQ